MKKSDLMFLLILGIGVVVAWPYLSGQQALAIGGAAAGAPPGAPLVKGDCPDTQISTLRFSALNKVADPQTAANTRLTIYHGTATVGTLVYSMADLNTSATLSCSPPEQFRVIWADGSTHYYWQEAATAGGGYVEMLDREALVIGAISVTYSNGTEFGSANTSLNLTSGADSLSTIKMKIKEDTADAYYGIPANFVLPGNDAYTFVACFDYNVNNFTSISLNGGTTFSVPTIASGYEKCSAYKAAGGLKDGGEVEVGIDIDVVSGVDPQVNGTLPTVVNVKVFDWASWLKNGQIKYGIENTDTNAAIAGADYTRVSAIQII